MYLGPLDDHHHLQPPGGGALLHDEPAHHPGLHDRAHRAQRVGAPGRLALPPLQPEDLRPRDRARGDVGAPRCRGLQPGADRTRPCSARSGATLYLGLGYRLDSYYAVQDQEHGPPGPERRWWARTTPTAWPTDSTRTRARSPALTLAVALRQPGLDHRPVHAGTTGRRTSPSSPTLLGSSQASTSVEAQFRAYVPLNEAVPRDVLGFWLYYRGITSGVAPYLSLPAIGWDQKNRTGRGYVQGRWRGTQELYGEVEWRFRITNNGLLGGRGLRERLRASPRRPSSRAAPDGATRARRSGCSSSSGRPAASACAS